MWRCGKPGARLVAIPRLGAGSFTSYVRFRKGAAMAYVDKGSRKDGSKFDDVKYYRTPDGDHHRRKRFDRQRDEERFLKPSRRTRTEATGLIRSRLG